MRPSTYGCTTNPPGWISLHWPGGQIAAFVFSPLPPSLRLGDSLSRDHWLGAEMHRNADLRPLGLATEGGQSVVMDLGNRATNGAHPLRVYPPPDAGRLEIGCTPSGAEGRTTAAGRRHNRLWDRDRARNAARKPLKPFANAGTCSR